jgi:hypothetical protein
MSESLNLIFWWVGAVVCGLGALAGVLFVAGLLVDYIWRRVWDFDAFRRVIEEARRQGVNLYRE